MGESFVARVIQSYRITIPEDKRLKLRLKIGDYVLVQAVEKVEAKK